MERSKTGSGDVLIKDVCSWYRFPSLMNSRFGSHKDVSHTIEEIEVPERINGMHWFGVCRYRCGDYANLTLFENLKLFPEKASNSTEGSAQSLIPACSVISAGVWCCGGNAECNTKSDDALKGKSDHWRYLQIWYWWKRCSAFKHMMTTSSCFLGECLKRDDNKTINLIAHE